jgi:phenylalanyl-tRNA synthetase beta chain
MRASVQWINDLLDRPASADEQADVLTMAGFPVEHREDVGGDVRLEVETTSNRGDCLCHAGLAREVAAMSGRLFRPRALNAPAAACMSPAPASSIVSVENLEPSLCPLYTARIIRGVKVRPSPAWIQDRLRAIGQIPRNNIVDATNFIMFELGQPTHVFDLARLSGPRIIIRRAKPGEPFQPIGEGASAVKLSEHDLVIADANVPVAIAGVKGGALSAVTDSTINVLIEAAVFDPVAVRSASRRLGIASDSSYRYERGVHAGQVNPAADGLAALLLETAGGTLCAGVVSGGLPIPAPRRISMRPARCRALLGIDVADNVMLDIFARLGLAPKACGDRIECAIPVDRLDLEREVDLIEEVARVHGLDKVPIAETLRVRVAPPQPTELAKRAVHDALAGMGFLESVTHSLVSATAAQAFLPPGMAALHLADDRARAEAALRPSILPSLLKVLAFNGDNGDPDVKLFESAATFASHEGRHIETVNLAFTHPAGSDDEPLRFTRGVIERLVTLLKGPDATTDVQPKDGMPWLENGAVVRLGGEVLGTMGLIAPAARQLFGLKGRICAAEVGLPALYAGYPPDTEARALPAFPAIERDISAVLADREAWSRVKEIVLGARLPHLEHVAFITTYRGKQVGAGRKSLSLRLRFRAPDRTLTHEEADDASRAAMEALKRELGAEIRS